MTITFEKGVISGQLQSHPHKVNKWGQMTKRLFAPIFYATGLFKVRYQKITSFEKPCQHIVSVSTAIPKENNNKINFSVLYKTPPFFLGMIRAPPYWNLILLSNSMKEGSFMSIRERYLIPIQGVLVEVSEEVYTEYYRMDRRERYLVERDRESGVFSYHSIFAKSISAEGGISDPQAVTLEERYAQQHRLHNLNRCIGSLLRSERELIYAIFYEGLRPSEYANRIGMTKRGVNKKKKRILLKMKRIMDYLDSAG